MRHLIGKTVTVRNHKYEVNGVNYYDVNIDDMNGCPLVCSDRVLVKL